MRLTPRPGQIFIKDVNSANGTFINGERLSQEGIESEPFELKTDDILVSDHPDVAAGIQFTVMPGNRNSVPTLSMKVARPLFAQR